MQTVNPNRRQRHSTYSIPHIEQEGRADSINCTRSRTAVLPTTRAVAGRLPKPFSYSNGRHGNLLDGQSITATVVTVAIGLGFLLVHNSRLVATGATPPTAVASAALACLIAQLVAGLIILLRLLLNRADH